MTEPNVLHQKSGSRSPEHDHAEQEWLRAEQSQQNWLRREQNEQDYLRAKQESPARQQR